MVKDESEILSKISKNFDSYGNDNRIENRYI